MAVSRNIIKNRNLTGITWNPTEYEHRIFSCMQYLALLWENGICYQVSKIIPDAHGVISI